MGVALDQGVLRWARLQPGRWDTWPPTYGPGRRKYRAGLTLIQGR